LTRRLQGGERKNRFRRILMGGRPWIECHYCGRHLTLMEITLDHVVPLSKGGAMGLRNIVPACLPCNRRKADMNYNNFVKRFAAMS